MERKEKAVGYFHSGCNCCQAVLCAFTDEQHAGEMKKLGAAFGLGMGNMEGTCGALVGAGLVLGLVNKDKAKSMKQMRQIMK